MRNSSSGRAKWRARKEKHKAKKIMTEGAGRTNSVPKNYENLPADTVYYELEKIRKLVELDGKRLDYKDMSDKELKKN